MAYRYRFNETRTFGCEFECVIKHGFTRETVRAALEAEGVQVRDLNNYAHTRDSAGQWEMKTDCSIHTDHNGESGLEIVSPILRGFAGIEQIMKVCRILSEQCRVNRSCGFHVHHGARDLNDAQFRSLYRAGHVDGNVMSRLQPPSRRDNHYCAPLCAYSLPSTDVPRKVGSRLGRYYAVNFASYIVRGTIEFRQHSATVEGKKAVAWIVFTQAMMEWAKAHPNARPQARHIPVNSHDPDGDMMVLRYRYGMRSNNSSFEGQQYLALRARWQKFNASVEVADAAEMAEIAEQDAR